MQFIQTDWIWGFAGGLIIGLAGALFLLANGRVMGASGIIGGLIDRTGLSSASERLSFIAGLVAVPAVIYAFVVAKPTHLTTDPVVLIVAGLCVGIGTRLANGCTSGHGVCGISRLSLRGMVATVFYILAGGLTVVIFRHWIGVL